MSVTIEPVAAPLVRLIVLNYDGGDDVLRCVDSLFRLDWPADRLEVVLIDNASTDGSADAVAEAYPAVRVIRTNSNKGFPANNLGFADIDDVDFVGLINNDAFVQPGFLGPLVATLEADLELGAACPKILLAERFVLVDVCVEPGARLVSPPAVPGAGWEVPDDIVDPRLRATATRARLFVAAGDCVEPVAVETDRGAAKVTVRPPAVDLINNVGNELVEGWFGADRGLHEPDEGQYDEPVDVPAWCGAAVLFPARYLQDVGGFDERLFLYYEDLDLAWRGRARGWRYRTAPSAVVRHRLAASSGVGSALFRFHVERNRLVVLAKNAPAPIAAGAAGRFLLATASYCQRDVLSPLLRGRRPAGALVTLRIRAFVGYLRLLPYALAQRRRINRSARVRVAARTEVRFR